MSLKLSDMLKFLWMYFTCTTNSKQNLIRHIFNTSDNIDEEKVFLKLQRQYESVKYLKYNTLFYYDLSLQGSN